MLPDETVLLRVERESDLFRLLSEINVRAMHDRDNLKKKAEEQWSVCRFLTALKGDQRLQYPFTLTHSDGPDFRLRAAQHEIGIEVTRATHPDLAWALKLAEDKGELVELSFFSPDTRIETKGTKPPTTSLSGPLEGPGWMGNEVEEHWAEFVHQSINEKTSKLHKIRHFDDAWLLVRDDTPGRGFTQHAQAVPMLERRLVDYWKNEDRFSSIFVLSKPHLFEFSESGVGHRQVIELWN